MAAQQVGQASGAGLLEAEAWTGLDKPERADAERLCELVDGQPLHLRQAAALVRRGATAWLTWPGSPRATSSLWIG